MFKWLRSLFRKKSEQRVIQTIYFIPGFGTDEKIFKNLAINNAKLVYINWIDPLYNESYPSYVQRMAAIIDEEEPIIIGVSFGGMVALEIARTRKVNQVILISSIKTTNELPAKWRLVGKLKLNKVLPIKHIQATKMFYALANKRVGAFTEEEITFANHYRRTIKPGYLVWALHQILNWKNDYIPPNIVHIHGTDDLIFPIKTSHPTHIIQGGTHMIVMNRAEEVSAIINEVLAKKD